MVPCAFLCDTYTVVFAIFRDRRWTTRIRVPWGVGTPIRQVGWHVRAGWGEWRGGRTINERKLSINWANEECVCSSHPSSQDIVVYIVFFFQRNCSGHHARSVFIQETISLAITCCLYIVYVATVFVSVENNVFVILSVSSNKVM